MILKRGLSALLMLSTLGLAADASAKLPNYDLKRVENGQKRQVSDLLKKIDGNALQSKMEKWYRERKRTVEVEFVVWNPEEKVVPKSGKLILLTLEVAGVRKPQFLFFQPTSGNPKLIDHTLGAPDQECGEKDRTLDFEDLESAKIVQLGGRSFAALKKTTSWPGCADFSTHEFGFLAFYLLGPAPEKSGEFELDFKCGFDGNGACEEGPTKGKTGAAFARERTFEIDPCTAKNCESIAIREREVTTPTPKSSPKVSNEKTGLLEFESGKLVQTLRSTPAGN